MSCRDKLSLRRDRDTKAEHLAAGWVLVADDELERQMFSDDCKRPAKAYGEGGASRSGQIWVGR